MSAIPGLIFPVGANLQAFNRDMDAAAKRLEEFNGAAASARVSGPSGSGGGSSTGFAAASFAPMATIASRLGQQLERLTAAISSGFGRMGGAAKSATFGDIRGEGRSGGRITAAANFAGGGARLKSKDALKGYEAYIKQRGAGMGGGGATGGAPGPAAVASSAKVAANMRATTRATQAATVASHGLGRSLLVTMGPLFAGFKAVEGFRTAVVAASDLNEQINASGVMFGAASQKIIAEGQRQAAAYGIVRSEYIKGVTDLGSLGKSTGQTGEQAAAMGMKFTQLAMDLSSIRNVRVEDALTAIRSGLSGESEPLRRFGVFLSEAAVKAQAAKMGIKGMGGELTEAQKVQARAAIISRDLAYANGDLANTAGGAANQMRALQGRAVNLAADFGLAIQPLTDMALKGANSFLTWAQSAVSFGSDAGGSISSFVTAIQFLPQQFSIAADQFSLGFLGIVEWLKVLPQNFMAMATWLGTNWSTYILDEFRGIGIGFQNLASNIQNLWTALWSYLQGGEFTFKWTHLEEGFRRSAEKLPEFAKAGVTLAMQDLEKGIATKQAKLMDDMVAKAQQKAAAAPTPAADKKIDDAAGKASKKKPKLLAAAVEFGSKEARSSILANRGLDPGKEGLKDLNKTSKKTLEESQRQTIALQTIARNQTAGLTALPL